MMNRMAALKTPRIWPERLASHAMTPPIDTENKRVHLFTPSNLSLVKVLSANFQQTCMERRCKGERIITGRSNNFTSYDLTPLQTSFIISIKWSNFVWVIGRVR